MGEKNSDPDPGGGDGASSSLSVPLMTGEKWWGGRVTDCKAMPFDERSGIRRMLDSSDRAGRNQAQPLLLSSAGRYIWSEKPFTFEFHGGTLTLSQGAAPFELGRGGGTLAEAFRGACHRFFPPSGRMPAPEMFTAPQFNTWIPLVYDQTEEKILAFAREIVAAGYPPGVFMIDDNWQEDYGVWQFSSRRFSNPKALIDELHRLGFKVTLWVCPFVSPDSETYRRLLTSGYLLSDSGADDCPEIIWANTRNNAALIRWWNGASAVLDLSNPGARAWFKGQLDALMAEYGIDGFKFDAGDSLFYRPREGGPAFRSFAARTPEEHTMDFAELGLDYPLNEYRACWKMGGQPLAQRLMDKDHSWAALRELIPGMITDGLLGYAFTCPDLVGGGLVAAFEDPAKFDPELVVRSAQVHALMPMMQFSAPPWRLLPAELARACLDAARLHADHGAEIVDLARAAARSGEPVVRPLAWQWPESRYGAIMDQFMLGERTLVAPVTIKGARTRRVVFPPGRWVDPQGAVMVGPCEKSVPAEIHSLPYYRAED